MSSDNIAIGGIADAIAEELNNYRREVVDKAVMVETKKSMKTLVKQTKATAPVGKRTKHYKDNIASKVQNKKNATYGASYSEVWYVKGADYRLSHLLNNGHALRDGGRYEGTKFITKATEEVETAYLENLKKAIENGG
jgi:hypothetical protein